MPAIRRTTALAAIAVVVAAGACTSSTAGTTSSTTTTTTSTATVAGDELNQQMCRTLELLESAGVTGPHAAASLEAVDLADAAGPQRSAYGDLLVGAPRSHCSNLVIYADYVAYWLGF